MKTFALAMTPVLAIASFSTFAGKYPVTYEITVQNITKGQIISPPIAIAHKSNIALFELGAPASEELARLAEDGDTSLLVSTLSDSRDVMDISTATGPIMPGQSVTLSITAMPYRSVLSVAGMLVSTNDAFFALNSKKLTYGHRAYFAPAYDAGSEENNELCEFIPGPGGDCGTGAGVRATEKAEGYVYPHPGISGEGDLSVMNYNWQDQTVKITVKAMPY